MEDERVSGIELTGNRCLKIDDIKVWKGFYGTYGGRQSDWKSANSRIHDRPIPTIYQALERSGTTVAPSAILGSHFILRMPTTLKQTFAETPIERLGHSHEIDETKGEIMGPCYKKTATKPLPAGAKIIVRKGQRLAEWIDAKGRRRTAPLTAARDRHRPDCDYRPDLHREVSGRLGDRQGSGDRLPG